MPHQFTRMELHRLVWSEPMKTLAARYDISDVGLSKACKRYFIPVPERGYWAKLAAGKNVSQRPLPTRPPGMTDEISIGARGQRWYRHSYSEQEVMELVPSPPVFEREIEEVIAEVRAAVGTVMVPKAMSRPHRLVAALLEADDERRRKAATQTYVSSWDQPQFDSPFEKRRLRLLNAIFMALARCGMKPWLRGREGRELGVQVNDQNVSFSVDDANVKSDHRPSEYRRPHKPSGRMKVVIQRWRSPDTVRLEWEDGVTGPVETFVTDIVVELIVTGERHYRAGAQHHYEWLVERKTRLLEEARRRKEEAERKERERLIRFEKERVDRLLADAVALRQAMDIRTYVQRVKESFFGKTDGLEELQTWEIWALTQADRIDPVLSRRFLESMKDPAE